MFGIDQQVQQTADAYRGKPQMLQQKYAQNQQLIDLLALQKLKSEKEEASRQMALQMGNQGKPPTIADQRESQVLDMTKKEIVDQQAGVMQQKMQQQQAAQQKLMQSAGAPQMPAQAALQQPPAAGLAGLPANNIAPKMMAGGGIVAFEGGGSTDKETKEEKDRRETAESDRARLKEFGASTLDTLSIPHRSLNTAFNLGIRGLNAIPGVSLPYFDATGGPGGTGFFPRLNAQTRENAANQAINASRRLPADEATPAYAGAVARQAQARDEAQPPAPPPQAAPQGTGGGASSNAPGTVGFGIQSLIGTKTPEEAARENEARAAAAANYTPEERAGKQRIIDERTAAYDRNKLNRMLLGMAGYSTNYGAIAGGGAAALNDADQAMRERQRGEGQLIDIGPESRKAGTKAGDARFKDVVTGMGHGVDAAARMAANATMAAGNMLKQKELDYNHAMQRISDFTRGRELALFNLEKNYIAEKRNSGILPGSTPTPQQKRDAEIMDTKYEINRSRLSKTPVEITSLRNRIGIPSYEGYSLVDTQNPAPKP